MKSREALRVLAEVSEFQWGMVTSAQASARGVSHMNLTRLTESGDLIRLSHGVYKDAGAPSDEYLDLRSAWLAADPTRLAWERLNETPGKVIVSGESASRLHGIGELRAMKSEFTTPTRKQTQRPDVRYRTRTLTSDDVTIRDGLPVTTMERTIADLVEDRQDLSLIGHVLRDAARQSRLDIDRLAELLGPLAERNGRRKGDGPGLLEDLMELAGIDRATIAKQIVGIDGLGALITEQYLKTLPKIDLAPLTTALDAIAKEITATIPNDAYQKRFAAVAAALSQMKLPEIPDLSSLTAGTESSGTQDAQARLAQQLKAIDWTTFAQATESVRQAVER